MRHGRYWLAILLGLLGGVTGSAALLLFGAVWTCKPEFDCADLPRGCGLFYSGLAFGPASALLIAWLVSWRRRATTSR